MPHQRNRMSDRSSWIVGLSVLAVAFTLAGCANEPGDQATSGQAGGGADERTAGKAGDEQPTAQPANDNKKGDAMALQITSTAFGPNERIPEKYTGEGDDLSPPLSWSGLPGDATSLALICDDPDAPTPEPWVHWVIYDIPADTSELPEGVAPDPTLDQPAGARQGENSWDEGQTIGYRGPMPPPGHGTHHYHFRLYALDTKLDLAAGATKQALLDAMSGHILGEAVLTGTYSR